MGAAVGDCVMALARIVGSVGGDRPYLHAGEGQVEQFGQHGRIPDVASGDLEAQIAAFVDHYNHYDHQRYHESINNVTPADVYCGRDKAILQQRERIKRKTLEVRRLQHRQHAA